MPEGQDPKYALGSAFASEMECGIREIALNFSQQLIGRYYARIYDALQLDDCNNDTTTTVHRDRRSVFDDAGRRRHRLHKPKPKAAAGAAGAATPVDYYVDVVHGDDNNSGASLSAPFQSITKAKNTIRGRLKDDNSHGNGGVRQYQVHIRAGTYFESVLKFDALDSGFSADVPVVYSAYNHEQVIVSGGQELHSVHFAASYAPNPNILVATLNSSQRLMFDQLFVNQTHRLVRARLPNGDPERDVQPQGYAFSVGQYNGQQPIHTTGIWMTSLQPSRNSSIYPWFGIDNDPRGGGTAYHVGYDASRFSDGKGFWNGSVPAGLTYNTTDGRLQLSSDIQNKNTEVPFMANVFHTALWGNWIFAIDKVNGGSAGQIGFSKGGFQEGRGGDMSSGSYNAAHPQPFYVSNDFQCLTAENEWYLDIEQQLLYLYPNMSDAVFMGSITNAKYDASHTHLLAFDVDLQFPIHYRIVEVMNGASNLEFNGLLFTHSLRTQLLGYEVPSGGDWSIHRGGSVFLEETHNITLAACMFLRTGGNSLFLSDTNTHTHILSNDFLYSGDSAIAIVGRAQMDNGYGANGVNGRYSNEVLIRGNYVELVGVYGKQTSAVFTSVAGAVAMERNVLHSGPRAGININDGFYGGKRMESNLVFNWVRETQDHGPINTWDRVCYVFPRNASTSSNGGDGGDGSVCGDPTLTPAWNRITHNLIYNGPNGNKGGSNLFPAVDNDDGSRQYLMAGNVFVYGGGKNYLGDDKKWYDNLVVFPSHWPGGGDCVTAWAGLYHDFTGNQCIANMNAPLGYIACNAATFQQSSKEMPFGENNSIFVPNAQFQFYCGNVKWTLADLQAHGWEMGSTVNAIPPAQTIVQMVASKILG